MSDEDELFCCAAIAAASIVFATVVSKNRWELLMLPQTTSYYSWVSVQTGPHWGLGMLLLLFCKMKLARCDLAFSFLPTKPMN